MLTVLGGLPRFERELVRARTDEGRARAVGRSVKLGRKPSLTPHQRKEGLRRKQKSEVVRETVRNYDVHNGMMSRLHEA